MGEEGGGGVERQKDGQSGDGDREKGLKSETARQWQRQTETRVRLLDIGRDRQKLE